MLRLGQRQVTVEFAWIVFLGHSATLPPRVTPGVRHLELCSTRCLTLGVTKHGNL